MSSAPWAPAAPLATRSAAGGRGGAAGRTEQVISKVWCEVLGASSIGAPGVIVNAVLDALRPLGVEHIDLPLTPEKVWRAIQDARA